VTPPIRLWVFNHPFRYITEQVEFFCLALKAAGYRVSVSRRPSPEALNVLVENFSPDSARIVAAFCREHRKRVAVVMTEHIDFLGGEVRFHGGGMEARDDYMAAVTKMGRLFSLLTLRDHVRCIFRLGDLPRLRNFGDMAPGLPIRTIPFPALGRSERVNGAMRTVPQYDLVFTGKLTEHRTALLTQLRATYRVLASRDIVSRHRRDGMNIAARFVVNLPQHPDWRWISTMRVLAALRCGRATVAVGPSEETAITPFCITISEGGLGRSELNAALANYNKVFDRLSAQYEAFVRSPENSHFPHEEFDLWARLEL
jgi:hypothetical protein